MFINTISLMVRKTLLALGLNDKEVIAYLAMLPLGTTTASSLAIRTSINRSTAQYICHQLTKKGFVRALQKNNIFYYTPEPPEKIMLLLDLQKREIEKKEQQVSQIMGELTSMIHPDSVMPKVTFYQGIDGIINLFEDVLKQSTTLYGALQLNSETHPAIIDYAFNDYMVRRVKNGNKAYMLFNDSPLTREYQKNDKKMKRTTMLLPEDIYPFNACYHIYKNKVAYYSFKNSDLTGVLIENDHIHETAMSIFKMAWQFATSYCKEPTNKKFTHPFPQDKD